MFTLRKSLEQKIGEWDRTFGEAMKFIHDSPSAEPAAISLTLPGGNPLHKAKALLANENFKPLDTVRYAHEWRKHTLVFLMNTERQAAWRDDCHDIPQLDTVRTALNAGQCMLSNIDVLAPQDSAEVNFHLCTTPNLIFILNYVLPYLQRCLLEAKQRRDSRWARFAASAEREALHQWITEKEEEITRIETAIAWVLLWRLEAGFTKADVIYDDGIAYATSEFEKHGFISAKTDPKTHAPVPLLPVYQRCDLRGDVYGDVLSYLHHKTENIVAAYSSVSHKKSLTPLQERFLALPLFQRGYVSSQGKTNHVLSTEILLCDGKIQVVPTKCQKFVPRSTRFLPRWLFQGIHLRAAFFHRHADLVAQLSTPLPDLVLEELKLLDKKALLRHPSLARLRKEHLLIEQAIEEVQREEDSLAWYQGTSKTMIRDFLTALTHRLEQCTEQEAKWLAAISDSVRGDADILTLQAVNALKDKLEGAHQAYQCYEKYAAHKAEQTRVKEIVATLAPIEEASEIIKNSCAHSPNSDKSKEPTALDRLEVEALSISMAADAAQEIQRLLMTSPYAAELDKKARALLERIADKQWTPPALVLATFNSFSQMLSIKSDVQPLQKRMAQLLQAKAQEAQVLREQQAAFHALHHAVMTIAGVANVPSELPAQLLAVSQEPDKVSLGEKKQLLVLLSQAATALSKQCVETRAYANACIEKSIETTEATVDFYNQCHAVHALLSEPAYSFLGEKLLGAWRQAYSREEGAQIEQLYPLTLKIASSLNNAIKRHNAQKEPLQDAYLTLKPQIISLGKTLASGVLPTPCKKAYQECCKFHARLERETLFTFVLPVSLPAEPKTPAIGLSLSLAKEWSAGTALTNTAGDNDVIPSMMTLAEQASRDFANLVSMLSDATKTDPIILSGLADELIRLGQFIQSWGAPTEQSTLSQKLDGLLWSYCQRWRTQEVTAGSSLHLHHRCSEPQERVLLALVPSEKPYEIKELIAQRKRVLDPNSAARFSDACHDYQRHVIARRQKALEQRLTTLSDHSLQQLTAVTGCIYPDRFKVICDQMVADDIVVITDPRLKLHKSEQSLFGLDGTGHTAGFFPSTTVTQEPLSVMLMEASVLFSRACSRLSHTPLLTLREIEEKEAKIQKKLSALPSIVVEKLSQPLPTVFVPPVTTALCKA